MNKTARANRTRYAMRTYRQASDPLTFILSKRSTRCRSIAMAGYPANARPSVDAKRSLSAEFDEVNNLRLAFTTGKPICVRSLRRIWQDLDSAVRGFVFR